MQTIASANNKKGFHQPSWVTMAEPMIAATTSDMTVGKKFTPLAVGELPNTPWNQIGSQ